MDKQQIRNRVNALHRWMAEEHYDAFIIPTTDPHNGEYTPDHWKAREWITGFDGSAGLAVVTRNCAALWTDSRYYLQAEAQLADTPFVLMKDGTAGVPSPTEWLKEVLPEGCVVSFYGEMFTVAMRDELVNGLGSHYKVSPSDIDPFRTIWPERPALPEDPLFIVPTQQAGVSAADKLRLIFDTQHAICPEATHFILNDLSEIAWALNLRGSDIAYNPLFVSYLIVGARHALLCTDPARITPEIKVHLAEAGVGLARYKGWKNFIDDAGPTDVPAFANTMNVKVADYCRTLGVRHHIIPWQVDRLKAVKNATEQAGFDLAMVRDGVAMVQFLRWLDEHVADGTVTEVTVDERLTALRAAQTGYIGLSFPTIAGYGPHGAIVHYEATPETAATLQPHGLLLLDSGAHYDCGTTDITRTIALGPVSDEERRVYTLVLKGHIALSRCRFPEGTNGLQLDLAARYAMWQEGYDFGHGTGHGVGHINTVHEGPQQVRKNLRGCTTVPFCAGMTITDEPGIYVAGRFGVRIENTLLTIEAGTTDFGRFLTFRPLTLCPIDTRPIDTALLRDDERQWLNQYHAHVYTTLMPHLTDEADRHWLKEATRAI